MTTLSTPPDELAHATWTLDLAVAGLLFVGTVLPLPLLGAGGPIAVVLGSALCATTVLRRRRPLGTLAATAVLCLLHLVLLPLPTPALLCVPLVAYSVARWVPGRRSRWVLVLGALGALAGPLRWHRASPSDTAGTATLVLLAVACGGLVLTCYAIGRRVRESAEAQRARVLAEAQRRWLEVTERDQAARADEATVRAQIARELHDIVAHSLSVMVVQAEGGRALAAKRPEQAAQVLDTIAETGREALTEMRRIVGVLRGSPDENVAYAPTPGLADIPEMVARSDRRVHLYVEGEPPEVPPTLGLTVFRVVQEAVTNFLKHAGPEASATVTLTYSPALVVAEVSDDGVGAAAGDGGGHGLAGMRERVTSMHGQLLAEPKKDGGFLVRAILPVPVAPRTTPSDASTTPVITPHKEER